MKSFLLRTSLLFVVLLFGGFGCTMAGQPATDPLHDQAISLLSQLETVQSAQDEADVLMTIRDLSDQGVQLRVFARDETGKAVITNIPEAQGAVWVRLMLSKDDWEESIDFTAIDSQNILYLLNE